MGIEGGVGVVKKAEQVASGKLRAGSPLHNPSLSGRDCAGRNDKTFDS